MRSAQAWVFQRNPRPARLQGSVTNSTVCEAMGLQTRSQEPHHHHRWGTWAWAGISSGHRFLLGHLAFLKSPLRFPWLWLSASSMPSKMPPKVFRPPLVRYVPLGVCCGSQRASCSSVGKANNTDWWWPMSHTLHCASFPGSHSIPQLSENSIHGREQPWLPDHNTGLGSGPH